MEFRPLYFGADNVVEFPTWRRKQDNLRVVTNIWTSEKRIEEEEAIRRDVDYWIRTAIDKKDTVSLFELKDSKLIYNDVRFPHLTPSMLRRLGLEVVENYKPSQEPKERTILSPQDFEISYETQTPGLEFVKHFFMPIVNGKRLLSSEILAARGI